jgi:phage FluMu protein Com
MEGDKIVKVKCNTCQKTHTYRSPDSASEATAAKRKSARKKREEAANAAMADFDELAKEVDLGSAETYSIKKTLDVRQVVEHPKFGTGIVFALKEDGKAEIVFRDGPRTLIHSRA